MKHLSISFLLLICVLNSFAQNVYQEILRYEHAFDAFNRQFWGYSDKVNNNSITVFSDRNVKTSAGKLVLSLTANTSTITGAQIRSLRTFKYGKFVAKLKPAKGKAIVSSFFLFDNWAQRNHEINFQFKGDDLSQLVVSLDKNITSLPLGFDASKNFHEYAIIWKQNEVLWEVDGKLVHKITENIPHQQMVLMLNVLASNTDAFIGQAKQTEVDYVKIYSFK